MKFYILTISVLLLGTAASVSAEDKDNYRDFDFVKSTTPYLNLSNPAALAAWDGKISKATVNFDKDNGGLTSLVQSENSYKVGAGTESFYRTSDRIAFHGGINWYYTQGRNMGGQILLDPDYNPVNFLETGTDTRGVRKRESYSLLGEMSYSFSDRWAAGIAFHYDALDQTKIKDPRFSTDWTDLSLVAGTTFRPSDGLMLGVSAFYRNTLEKIQAGIYGPTDKQYFLEADRGGFFGTVFELVGDHGFLTTKGNRPMDNTFLGGAVQAVIGGVFSNELTFKYRNGYYGRKSSGTAVFYEFDGAEIRYDGALTLPVGSNIHKVTLSASYSKLANSENSFNFVTPLGGVTVVEYTGESYIYDETVTDGALGYVWYHNVSGNHPDLTLGANVSFHSKKQATSIYPFYRNHNVSQVDADIYCIKSFDLRKSKFVVEAHGLCHTGYGDARDDGEYTHASYTILKSFDTWLDWQYEYETAKRAGAALAFKWEFPRPSGAVPYIKVADTFQSLLKKPEFVPGRTRNTASITLGINF
ncbi:MAG: hypothetical protein IK143_00025 [Bacteroidales bacterium]|nr:hypothetical protein [Bacteroidales bacterium]